MSFFSFFQNNQSNNFFAIDIGDHSVKCLVIKDLNDKKIHIVGHTVVDLEPGDVYLGQIVNIHPVVEKTAIAIDNAIQSAGIRPKNAVAGISGIHIVNENKQIVNQRKDSKSRITPSELSQILTEAQKEIKKEIQTKNNITKDIELINASIFECNIDQVLVKNPIDFIGQEISIKLFCSFAPQIQLNAIQSVADNLKLNLISTVNHSFALFRSLIDSDNKYSDAIIIDIGEYITDISVISDQKFKCNKTYDLGANIFTKTLSDNLEVNLKKANRYKIDYSQNILSDKTTNDIYTLFQSPIDKFNHNIIQKIKTLVLTNYPRNIFFTGGGAMLPSLIEDFYQKYLELNKSATKPIILSVKNFEEVVDHTNSINNTLSIPAIAIAKLGTQFHDYDSNFTNIIKNFYQTLRT